ncbi:uncharacterized protein LOC124643734 [Helicoverpa zea]|uniref:uncharacterized protein LOC124643734 n=1 Tax=Helicoverpa zea TaxID=7113 RepID=UPI001F5630DC|nr:uncharacterized protein LOC124643734 [Helicoverpa zea]
MLILFIYFVFFVFKSNAFDLSEKLELRINNELLTDVKESITSDYEAVANYTYDEGEDIDFKCIIINSRKDRQLRLEYYNARDEIIFKTVDSKVQTQQFRSILKSENDKYYLDCVCKTSQTFQEYRYRVFFNLRIQDSGPNNHALSLFINGERHLLCPKEIEPSYDDYRPYKFIDGEQVNITCKKNKTLKGDLRFYFPVVNNTSQPNATYISESEIMLSLLTMQYKIHGKALVCLITNSDVTKPNTRVEFISDVPESGIRITGLKRKNIMYQFTNASKWTIVYQYAFNEKLNLTCVVKRNISISTHQIQWKFEGETLASDVKFTSTALIVSTSRFVQMLDETYDRITIQCIYQNSSQNSKIAAEVVLHYNPELAAEIQSKNMNDDESQVEVIGLTIAAVVLAVAVVITCFVLWLKRNKHSRLIENAYDDLQSQNETPIPVFPSQWESDYSHYTKIDEGVTQQNYNYAGFNDFKNRQSNTPSENYYTEIDDYFKPKVDGRGDVWKLAIPTADKSKPSNPFDDTYNNLNHNLAIDNKVTERRTDVYGNDTLTVKKNSVTFQDEEPRAGQGILSSGNPFRSTNPRLNDEKHEDCEINDQTNLPGHLQVKDNNCEDNMENAYVYAEPYSEFDKIVTNTLYEKMTECFSEKKN